MANTNSAAHPVLVEWLEKVSQNPDGRSVEDLLHIQDWLQESLDVEAQVARARVIEETDTRDESNLATGTEESLEVVENASPAFLCWSAPSSPLCEALAAV